MQAERRSNAVTELVEVLMNEVNNRCLGVEAILWKDIVIERKYIFVYDER